MKVKARFGLFAAIACCGLLLAGCGGGGNTPEPTETFHVVANYDTTKVSVSGLGDTYAEGAAVSFTLAELDADHYKVDQVTSMQTTINRSGLNCNFVMPDSDVTINITTKVVEQYTVEASTDDAVVGEEVTFVLKYGGTAQPVFTIEKTASESKSCTISSNKVTFNEAGTFHLLFKKSGTTVVPDYTISVRNHVHGETEDDPLTVAEAIAIGHELDITWNEKVDGVTVWHYGGVSEIKYYVKGIVTEVNITPEEIDQYKNMSCHLGDFQIYQVSHQTFPSIDELKSVQIGTEITVYTKLMNFGGKNTAKANGTVETYKKAPEYPAITKIDNTVLQEVVLDQTSLMMAVGTTKTLTATLHPNTGATISWSTSNNTVASVSNGVVTANANGNATITASAGGKTATCQVAVSDVEMVFRALLPSELEEGVDYYLGAYDTALHYAKDAVASTYYVATTTNQADASKVRITKSSSQFIVKLGNSYLGYQYSDGHHNILRESDASSTKIVKFDYDASTGRLTFTGNNSASLYLNFYSNNMSYATSDKTNPHFSIWGYGAKIAVSAATVVPASVTVAVGGTKTLSYTVSPFNATVDSVAYTSSATGKATVDNNGLVTGVAAGSATITLTINGSVTATCAVTVSNSGWSRVTSTPTAGTGYRLVLDRGTTGTNSGNWYLTGNTQGQEYRLQTNQSESSAAAVELIAATGGFKVKIGSKYLFIGANGTYTNSLLKTTEAEATVLTFNETLHVLGVTISSKFWALGTRNDQNYTTAEAVNLTQYPDNFKVYLEHYSE